MSHYCFLTFQRIIVRIWGRTILDKTGDIEEEVVKAFSTKPCIGILGEHREDPNTDGITVHELPIRRHVPKECNVWSAETYQEENGNCLEAAACQSCRNFATEVDGKGMTGKCHGSQIKEEVHIADISDLDDSMKGNDFQ